MHSDLKLGLVLVPAAALLEAGRPDGLLLYVVRDQLELGPDALGLMIVAGGVGSLAVVAAAIRVDRHIPHTMMAVGAVIGACGIAVVLLSDSLALSALGVFIAGVGHSAVGSLVFYAVAVKGAVRFRGTLIGALGMVYTIRLGSSSYFDWPFESTVIVLAITLVLALAGAALLLRQLPQALGRYSQPIGTLSNVLSESVIRRNVSWAAVVFAVASFVAAPAPLGLMNFMMYEGAEGIGSQLQTAGVVTGVGVLLWGIAADFYPARRLMLVAGLLMLPAAGVLWALDSLSATAISVSLLGLAHSSLICLPWVLMANLLPNGHFAKIAVAITLVGGFLGSSIGSTTMGVAASFWSFDVVFWIVPLGGIIVAIVATRLPKPLSSDALLDLEEKSRIP